jgi:uncharacterized protein DUF6939
MQIVVESRRKKLASVEKLWPGAAIIDVTSKGAEPWVRFSPFYPHGGIPIPNTPSQTAQSVEGLWQGLKVFEREDIDPGKWAITDMSGIKRGGKSRGAVRGHRFGVGSDVLFGYREARFRIYLPTYRWVLQNRLAGQVEELRRVAANKVASAARLRDQRGPRGLVQPAVARGVSEVPPGGSMAQITRGRGLTFFLTSSCQEGARRAR